MILRLLKIIFVVALEKIGDNVWEYDFRTGMSFFSRAENELLGFSIKEPNDNNAIWRESIHKDDRILLEENECKYRSGDIDSHSLEYRMMLKDGSMKWILDRGVVIEKSPEGLPLKLVGTHTDITFPEKKRRSIERKRAKMEVCIGGFRGWSMGLECTDQ